MFQRIKKHWRKIVLTLLGLALFFLISPALVRHSEANRIFTVDEVEAQPVALVFGAGISKNGGPSDALYDRLTVAAQLYKAGKVSEILVSGDNSTEEYNEPDVMSQTLQKAFKIPSEAITADYAGRRTYDSCIRAKEVFGVENAILVTQEFHLPRALYTCKALGVDSVGVSASLQPYVLEAYYTKRETLALYKMLMDLYLWSPDYIE